MFTERSLADDLASLRDDVAPGALVLDAASDFETLPPAAAEDLLPLTDSVAPLSYDEAWLPEPTSQVLARRVGGEFLVGSPEDGSVTWTTQTDPPVVVVKPRVEGVDADFVDFLVAEALVEAGAGLPEHFLGFFREKYRDFANALDAGPEATYQAAAAVYAAYRGLHTRETFRDWADDRPRLHEAWRDAGERLAPRVADVTGEVARGETSFTDAAELACSAVKHDVAVPEPFDALDTLAYRDHGAAYAVEWAAAVRE